MSTEDILEKIRKMEESMADGVFSFRNKEGAIILVLYNFERQLCMSVSMSQEDFDKHSTRLAKTFKKKAPAKKTAKVKKTKEKVR